jgi:valyl-tRNA synthetase
VELNTPETPGTLDPVALDHSITGKIASVIAASTPEGGATLQTGNVDAANPSVAVPMGAVADGATHSATSDQPLESRWINARLSESAAAVNASLADYRFDEAASHVYQFFWGDLCDWYLEIVKLRLNFDDRAQHAQTSAALTTLVRVFESALRLLSPFMPFITDEIWHALYADKPPAKSIALTRFPQPQDYPADPAAIRDMTVLQELITTIRAVRKELGVPEKETAPIRIHAATQVAALAEANADMLSRLARVSAVELAPAGLTGTSARSTSSFDVAVLYERQIDVAAERERLTKELAKLEKQLTANEQRLGDPKFTEKAPAHIVDGLRKQTAELRTLRDKTRAALDALPPQ